MAIQYRCPECDQLLSIASRMAGKRVSCPTCGADTTVPHEDDVQSGRQPPLEADRQAQSEQRAARFAAEKPESAGDQPPGPSGPPGARPTRHAGAARPQTEPAVSDDEPLVFRKAETQFEGMDLTPMVDVTFLLLIFFMITASFSLQKTIQVPPPDPEQQGAVQTFQTLEDLELTSVIVQIDEKNTIFVDYDPVEDKTALPDVLRDKLQTDQKTELVLQSDPRAFHETVIAVIDAANEVQFQKIRLATVSGAESDF